MNIDLSGPDKSEKPVSLAARVAAGIFAVLVGLIVFLAGVWVAVRIGLSIVNMTGV